jgi:hypothetical protein
MKNHSNGRIKTDKRNGNFTSATPSFHSHFFRCEKNIVFLLNENLKYTQKGILPILFLFNIQIISVFYLIAVFFNNAPQRLLVWLFA